MCVYVRPCQSLRRSAAFLSVEPCVTRLLPKLLGCIFIWLTKSCPRSRRTAFTGVEALRVPVLDDLDDHAHVGGIVLAQAPL